MEYGIQMYSVRDLTKESLDEALRQVAELGYKFIEFAGFFGHTAEEVKGMLDKYGLSLQYAEERLQTLFGMSGFEIVDRFRMGEAIRDALPDNHFV